MKCEVDNNQTLHDGLLKRYKEVDVAGGVGASKVFIVDKATLSRSSPRLSQALLVSLVFGLGVALGLALLLEHLDDAVRLPTT